VTSFTYGILSNEKEEVQYTTGIYAGDELLETETFSLMPGEKREERKVLDLSAVHADRPFKVSVRVSASGRGYEVHYWIRNKTLT